MSNKNTFFAARPVIRSLAAVALVAPVLTASGAVAQESGRYRLEQTETGYVRLDTKTGAISVCTEQSQGQMICKMATEDREAYENHLADLQDRVKVLEDRLAAIDQKGSGNTASSLPSEQEFEQSMSYMERFMRRFMDIAKSFESEPEKPAETTPTPPGGRT
ncbi:hypothetical protein BRY73_06240 [Ochrobactrum sp. P6BS-III]|uniref:hypothetical protein n=1 Tax=unclassified Ochrobactrum TaxID=239106 RepID=UPI0009926693|nr:hypothetical protein [Ochrobactrum sp. P6BSIII]OOL18562.1 hypothetical protein BRY73_06240 [Ochrobactrum sp. P6BS-III]